MSDENFLSTFIAECQDNLTTVENDLVELERSGSGADPELVNRIFRAAHSIKGGAGFLDLDSIKELAHRLESVLDMVRSKALVPDPEVTSVLLRGFDRLGELVRAAGEGGTIDSSEELDSLTALLESRMPPGREVEAVVRRSFSLPGSDRALEAAGLELELAAKAGKSLLMLRFDLIHDVQRLGKTPFDILSSLARQGDVLDCIVDIASAGSLDDEDVGDSLPFFVLFASSASVVRIAKENDLPLAGITALDVPASPVVSVPPNVAVSHNAQTEERRKGERRQAPRRESDLGGGREESARISLALLDKLMAMASELVLARNELLESLRSGAEDRTASAAARRVDQVTREIQETVTLTRMQPIGNLFDRYPRLARDLALETGKKIELAMEGREVEVDRSILEALADPLVHLVRNACDHGVEAPERRAAAGKPAAGAVAIRARHEAGTIVVEVEDDGAGIDADAVAAKAVSLGLVSEERAERMSEQEKQALIFLPGLSTSAKVTEISGRGVGMDVVKANVDKLGGQIEISSERGRGTSFRLRMPLTLAIIPSLLVSDGGERYAIPETNVEELLRVREGDAKARIERAGDDEVLVLRGEFIPLRRLSAILGSLGDGRDRAEPGAGLGRAEVPVVVVNSRALRYALAVDELHDTMEIVVKPLGRHFAKLREYSGATILGNGETALILDTTGLAAKAGFAAFGGAEKATEAGEEAAGAARAIGLLLFGNGPKERCAVPLEAVDRVLKLRRSEIDRVGQSRVFSYEGRAIPLFQLADALEVDDCLESEGELDCIVFTIGERRFGLVASPPVDSTSEAVAIDPSSFAGEGLRGSAIVGGRTVLVVDVRGFAAMLRPDWFGAPSGRSASADRARAPAGRDIEGERPEPSPNGRDSRPRALVADDSNFFRDRVSRILEEEGYSVVGARDGAEALAAYEANSGSLDACVFDLEMPGIDGFELMRRLRSSGSRQPAIALTSLASEEDERRALEAGFDSFLVKLDRGELVAVLQGLIERTRAPESGAEADADDKEGEMP
jgi:Chemotaxis protein histidine kinase and related kinases